MRNVTRTLFGIGVQTAQYLGILHDIRPYTSLDEAMLDPLIVPFQPSPVTLGMAVAAPYDLNTDTAKLYARYMVIGNGGHYNVTGPVGGAPYPDTKPHRPTDSGLYHMIPFVVKPVTNDLSSVQRAAYRLRKTMLINGDLYAAYYARTIDLVDVTPETTLTTVTDTVPVTTTFVATSNNLRPTPPSIGTVNDGSYGAVHTAVTIIFTEQETTWLREACLLLFGDENQAIISEIGICTGAEREITHRYPDSGAQVPITVTADSYFEAVGVQIAMHLSTVIPLIYSSAGFEQDFDIGVTEPLYGIATS